MGYEAGKRLGMTCPNQDLLCVKCLAPVLGVSVRYVYEMRRCGFEMQGRPGEQRCTVAEAVAWIEASDFRMVRGRGRVGCKKVQTA
jgi:hypothetical protein